MVNWLQKFCNTKPDWKDFIAQKNETRDKIRHGRAIFEKCDVNFKDAPNFSEYKVQDHHGDTII